MDPQVPVTDTQPDSLVTPPPTRVNRQRNSTLIMLSAFLIVLVGIVAFLTYQNFQLQKQITSLQKVPSPTPTATADPTANWKTYTNNTYGYSIKLPDNFTQLAIGPDNGTKINDADWNFADQDVSKLDAAHKAVAYGGAVTLEIGSYSDAFQENYNMHCNESSITYNQKENVVSHTSLVQGAEQYIQAYSSLDSNIIPNSLVWASRICFIHNKIDYELNYDNYKVNATDPLINQILSTFKLTDQTSSVNLKTYTDPKYGFSFSYPTGWTPIIKTVNKGQTITDPGFYTIAATEDDVQALRLTKNGWTIEINSQKIFQPGSCGGISGINNISDFKQISTLGIPAWREDLENGKFWAGGDEPDPHPQPIFFGGDSTYQYRFCSDNTQLPLRLSITYYSPSFTAANIQSKNIDYSMINEMDGILKTLH